MATLEGFILSWISLKNEAAVLTVSNNIRPSGHRESLVNVIIL